MYPENTYYINSSEKENLEINIKSLLLLLCFSLLLVFLVLESHGVCAENCGYVRWRHCVRQSEAEPGAPNVN